MKMKKRLGDLLVDLGYITIDDVKDAIKIQKSTGKRLGEIFVEGGLIEENTLLNILEVQLGIPRIDLENEEFDMKAISSINESLARKYIIIPVKFDNDKLVLAMSDPLNIFAEEDVAISTGYKLEIRISSKQEVINAISKYYSKSYMDKAAEKMQIVEDEKENEDTLLVENEKSPAIKLIDTIIENAVRNKASDIHIEPQKSKVIIRYRVDGKLKKQFEAPKEPFNSMITRIKLLGGMDIAERRTPQDGKIVTKIDGREIDLRVSILPSVNGENLVIRILDKKAFKLTKENLGFREKDLIKLEKILKNPYGMILVTGPTGSGKSSTLYSLLRELNNDENNIITIEDPVEYTLEGMVQVSVNLKAGLNFANGLKSILRQDPDVIMVGEIRDEETAVMAIRAAITGHLVLSTLHTSDAPGSIIRLEDMGVKNYLIASSLTGVIAQRLVRRLCPYCKREYEATIHEKEILDIDKNESLKLYKACGCNKCSDVGYKGRIGIFEIMEISDEMRAMIGEGLGINHIIDEAKKNGMNTLFDSAKDLVLNSTTSMSELLGVTLIKG